MPARASRCVQVVYRPEPHQWQMHRAREMGAVYRWLCSGVGGGKTYWAVWEDLLLATQICPTYPGLLVVPDYRALHEIVIPKMEAIWPQQIWSLDYRTNGPQIVVRSPKGPTVIFVRSAHDRGSIGKIVGFEVAWIHFEELGESKHTELAWKTALERLRIKGAPYLGVHVASTPKPGPLPRLFGVGAGLPAEARTVGYWPDRQTYIRQARIEDNPHIDESAAERLRAAFGDTDFARQELDGEILAGSGRIYDFHRGIHTCTAEQMDLLLRRSDGGRRFGGLDWGYRHPGAAVACAMMGDMVLVWAEWYQAGRSIQEQGVWCHQHGGSAAVWDADSAEPRNIDLLRAGWTYAGRRYPGLTVRPARAKRDWQASTSVLQSLFARRPGHHPVTGADWRPGILISEACANLISELEEYRLDVDFADPDRIPDNKTVGSDHAIDALRYAVYSQAVTTETRTWGRRDDPSRRLW